MSAQKSFSRIPISKSARHKLLALAAIAGVIVLSFAAGYFVRDDGATPAAPSTTHQVSEVAKDQSPQEMDDDERPGTVRVSPAKQQLMGIKLDTVKKAACTHLLKVPGRVVPDETRLYQVNAAIEGWIVKIMDGNTSGDIVKKDQLLALFASPNSLTTQQSYLNALVTQERYGLTYREKVQQFARPERTTKQYRYALSSLGMTDTQIEQITKSRDWHEYIQVRAPGPGFVLKRNITTGLRFDKGTPFYTIADLSRIWIVADLYENEASYFQPGKTIRITLPGQSKDLTARVSAILPQFDPASRTLKVRLEAGNPGYHLRPDMFVDVELPVTAGPGIFIPADAVLDTGLKKTVFVARGEGSFEPRRVTTGRRLGSFVEIEQGLDEGDRIVTAGNFLLDAESKLELAAAGVNAALEIDPVCGMGVAPKKAHKAGRESRYQGKTYYFCSDECRQSFGSNPERFLTQAGKHSAGHPEKHGPGHAGKDSGEPVIKHPTQRTQKQERMPDGKRAAQPSAAGVLAAVEIDPVCGMRVVPEVARKVQRESLHQGKTYYFCSDQCKQLFEGSPESFLTPGGKQKAEHPEKHDHANAGKRTGVRSPERHARVPAAVEIDPVCGMRVKPETALKARRESLHQGKIYYFCSDQCKQLFESNPESFLTPAGKHTAEHPEKHEGMQPGDHAAMPGPEPSAKGHADPVMDHPGEPDGADK
ncbi:MAG: efflux RND transporter periplasmic adaptor subunit [Deltaproteobacteria bacterium]|nr:efflux RND transporter periplasmic adaptor subunit [Deltaproteobacteria bacterium]